MVKGRDAGSLIRVLLITPIRGRSIRIALAGSLESAVGPPDGVERPSALDLTKPLAGAAAG